MVLIEALCALLIFSVGVLGLVGLQSTSVRQAAAAEYRSTAVLQANDLISRMWVSDRSDLILKTQYASGSPGGAGYAAWRAAWQNALPGADAAENMPTVTFEPLPGGAPGILGTNQVTISIRWKAPNDEQRKYTVVAQLDQMQK